MSINPDINPSFSESINPDTKQGIIETFKNQASALFSSALILIDIVMTGLAFYTAYILRLQSEYQNISLEFDTYFGMMFVHIVSLITTFFFYCLYHRRYARSHIDEFYGVFGAGSVGAIISIAMISFVFKNTLDYPRLMMVYAWLLTIVFVSVARILYSRLLWSLRARGWEQSRLLIIGTGDVGRLVMQKIKQSPGLGYDVVGFISETPNIKHIFGKSVLGHPQDVSQIIERYHIDEVIIAMHEASHQDILSIIANCERERVAIKIFPDVFQILATEVSIDDLDGLPLLSVRDVALRGWRLTVKRIMDIIVSGVLLVIFSPLMLLVALLIKLDSPGPVFYIQERMGLDGKPFNILKFRSMRVGADTSGAGWTTKDDVRKTQFGTFLRHYSVDELPQFINVLLGEMSMVGPRPERPVYVEQFRQSIPRYMERHREKAGMTGWAQINGLRGDTSIIERTKYDLWYIENWSILLDIKIMLRTAVHIFFDKNAY